MQFHTARFVAKMDDDAYVHVPDLLVMLRTLMRTTSHTPFTYFGSLSWFHWYPAIFERSGFGYTFDEAYWQGRFCRNASAAAKRCRNAGCGACIGPFPFASGFLIVLSTPLTAELASSYGLQRDLELLQVKSKIVSRSGRKQGKLMEDIWLGSLIHRFPPSRPVRYVALSEASDPALVSDNWGLRARPTALVIHVRGKQLERFLTAHDFMSGDEHCSQQQEVECEEGCTGFVTKAVDLKEIRWGVQRVVRPLPRPARLRSPAISGSAVCSASQRRASFCRLRPTSNATPCNKQRVPPLGINLLPRVQNPSAVLLDHVALRKQRVLQTGTARHVANVCQDATQ